MTALVTAVPLLYGRCNPYGAETGGPRRVMAGLHGPASARLDSPDVPGLPAAVIEGEWSCRQPAAVRVRMTCGCGHQGDVMPLCTEHDEVVWAAEWVGGVSRKVKTLARVPGHFEMISRRQCGACLRCAYPGKYAEWYKAIGRHQAELAMLNDTGQWRTDRAEYKRQAIRDIVAEFDAGQAAAGGPIHRCPMTLVPVSLCSWYPNSRKLCMPPWAARALCQMKKWPPGMKRKRSTSMANASTVRQWARDNGHGQVRGKLPASVTTAWDEAHPDDPYQVHQVTGTISADEMDEFFPGPDDPGSIVDDGYDTSEVKPSRPAAKARGKNAAARAGGWPWGKQKPKTGRKQPRASTEDLWAAAWRFGAKVATPLPPLYRVLRVQSVVAGPLIEDAVKDTVIDAFAQPLARLAGAGKTVNALLGPPVIISMMAFHAQQQQARGAEPNPLVMTLGEEALRSSLLTLLDIGGPKFEQAVARERDQEERLGMSVDAFMSWLWMAPAASDAEREQEEAVFRHIVHADGPADA